MCSRAAQRHRGGTSQTDVRDIAVPTRGKWEQRDELGERLRLVGEGAPGCLKGPLEVGNRLREVAEEIGSIEASPLQDSKGIRVAGAVDGSVAFQRLGPHVQGGSPAGLAIGRAIQAREALQGGMHRIAQHLGRVDLRGSARRKQLDFPNRRRPIPPQGDGAYFLRQHVVDEEVLSRPVVAVNDRELVQMEVETDDRNSRVDPCRGPFDGRGPTGADFIRGKEPFPRKSRTGVVRGHRLPVEIVRAAGKRDYSLPRTQARVPSVARQAHDGMAREWRPKEFENSLKRTRRAGPVRGDVNALNCRHAHECRSPAKESLAAEKKLPLPVERKNRRIRPRTMGWEARLAVTWEIATLPNGLRIVTTPMPSTQAVSVNLFVGVGSRSEPQRLNGITHFLEHMVFKGTERRPDAVMIAQEIEGAGGTLNAYTNKEFTCYWNIVPYDRFETALDVAADMLLHSKLEEAEIVREATVVQQELKRNHDNPGAWAGRLIGTSVYGEQPPGWDVGGTGELVAQMHRDDFIEHITAWYRPSNIVLSVAGNVSHERVVAQAEPLFRDMKAGPLPEIVPYDPTITGPRVETDSRDIDQCSLYLGAPIFGRDDPDRFALRVFNDVLGAGMSSRLFREVRERRGLAYSVGSGYGYLADAGVFTISAGVNREHVVDTIKVCMDEAMRLTDEPVPEEELRKAKDHNIGRFRLSNETAHSVAQRHGELLLTKGEIESIDSVVQQINAVTVDEVLAVGRRILQPQSFHCAVVGPHLNDDEIATAIG